MTNDTTTDLERAEAGKQAADFMRAATALAKQHKLSTRQAVNCFGYITRLMVETEVKRGMREPEAMTKYLQAFMGGLGAECEIEHHPDIASAHGAPLQ